MRLLLAASAAISALALGAAAHAQPAQAYGYDQNGNPMGDYSRAQDEAGQDSMNPPPYGAPQSAPQYGQYGAQPYSQPRQPQYGQSQYGQPQSGQPQYAPGPQDADGDQDDMNDQDAGDQGYGPPPPNGQGYADQGQGGQTYGPPSAPPSYDQGQRGGMSTSPDPSWSGRNAGPSASVSDGSDLLQREVKLERQIRRAGERGAIQGYEADNMMVELSSIRAQQEELSRRDNGLNYTDRNFITNRLARLEGQFHQER